MKGRKEEEKAISNSSLLFSSLLFEPCSFDTDLQRIFLGGKDSMNDTPVSPPPPPPGGVGSLIHD